ncbi:hypothetical protein [Kribbella sp. NPDC003557]|uniref:hypothetical protein n=1 Tax=Kribbella sp. NPDC003557 TaxID=3154449 RepID=UPI00339E7D7C
MRFGRELVVRAAESLRADAWQVNTVNGVRSRVDAYLYTDGARRLQTLGVASLGGSDWIRFELD